MSIFSWFKKTKENSDTVCTPNTTKDVPTDNYCHLLENDNVPNLDDQQENNREVSALKKDPKMEQTEAIENIDDADIKIKGNQREKTLIKNKNNGKNTKIKKTTIKKNKSFTDKQWRFVEEYLIDFNGKQAAIRAGYSKNNATETASDVLSYTHVVAEISKRREMISDKAESDAVYVMRRLKAESVDVINGNAASRVRALELIGKRNGMFTDKIQHQVEALQININTDVTTTFKSPDSQDDNGEQTGSESTESNDASQ